MPSSKNKKSVAKRKSSKKDVSGTKRKSSPGVKNKLAIDLLKAALVADTRRKELGISYAELSPSYKPTPTLADKLLGRKPRTALDKILGRTNTTWIQRKLG